MNATASKDSAGRANDGSTRTAVLLFVGDRRWLVVALAMTSLVSGLCDAFFLVLVTRTLLAASTGKRTISVLGLSDVSLMTVTLVAVGLVLIGVLTGVINAALSSRLSSEVVASTRRKLASAFLRATWEVQQGQRTGQLQELLTTFTAQGAALISSLTLAITAGFSLIGLLAVAISLGPVQALLLMLVLVALSLGIKPLRAAVRRRAQRSARTGMRFATSLSEVSELGMEVHVFNVQSQAENRVFDLIRRTAQADRKTGFARGLMGPIYSAGAYGAVLIGVAVIVASKASGLESLGGIMLVMLRSLTYGQALQGAASAVAASVPYVHALHDQIDTYEAGRQRTEGAPVGKVGPLTFDRVWFSYEAEKPVLKDISFELGEREIVGIVGPSGGGKSTLVQLLLGLREADAGRVLADLSLIHI